MSVALAGAVGAEAEEQARAVRIEREQQPGWAMSIEGESEISVRADGVLAALHSSPAPEPATEALHVVALDDAFPEPMRQGNGTEGCSFMEVPGSRIREWRCYYPSEGEKLLNRYQFRQEIREMIQRQEDLWMREAEAEARLHDYLVDGRRPW